MKKIVISISLFFTLISCKKENTTTSTNNENNITDTVKTNVAVGKQGPSISDVEGNSYKTVYIGAQHWMAENLKTSSYNDRTLIPNVTENTQWVNLTSGAWCYYENDETKNPKFGKLYNWFTLNSNYNENKNVCPTGWHIPSKIEWNLLVDNLGGELVAGGKMKEIGSQYWKTPNTSATNESLLSVLPSGSLSSGQFYNTLGKYADFWTSSVDNNGRAFALYLSYNSSEIKYHSGDYANSDGYSVRCIKD
jgi:uncharacterized protein (TIGR02145 family)